MISGNVQNVVEIVMLENRWILLFAKLVFLEGQNQVLVLAAENHLQDSESAASAGTVTF